MLKFKDSKKKFTIIYETDDMTENHIIDGKVLNEYERELVFFGDRNRGDIFILTSEDDIEEWNEMMECIIEDEEEWDEKSRDLGLSNYFNFV
mgnify:FL=1